MRRFFLVVCYTVNMFTKLFGTQFILVLVIGVIHSIFLWYSVYWRFVWLDVPVHFLGGIWAGLFAWWFIRDVYRLKLKGLHSLLMVLTTVLAIGVGWEVFEVVIGTPQAANYWFDTKLDLTMDTFGGLTTWGILRALHKI